MQSTEKHFIKFYIVVAQQVSNAVAYFIALVGHVKHN